MLPAGAVIGTYRVVRELGRGASGMVYLGEHTLLGRSTAIKVLRPLLSTDAEMVKRFFNEARALTRIADPGIVQIFDFGHDADGNAFIVMELLDGETMDRRLKRVGRFGPSECLRLLRMICTSLGIAHAKGIVHRDLKPENIFIVDDPAASGGERTKILDFGIAKLSGDDAGKLMTHADVLMGTPMYMSPEQCRGGGDVDHRADIYAIGCVMFTMLTGRPPFDGVGSGDLLIAHLNEPPPLVSSRVPDMPAVLDEVLRKCLQKLPARRFQSMAELVSALDSAGQALFGWNTVVNSVEPPSCVAAPTSSPLLDTQIPEPGIPSPTLDWSTTTLLDRMTLHDASVEATTSVQEPQRSGRAKQRWSAGVVAATVSIAGAVAFVALRCDTIATTFAPVGLCQAVPGATPSCHSYVGAVGFDFTGVDFTHPISYSATPLTIAGTALPGNRDVLPLADGSIITASYHNSTIHKISATGMLTGYGSGLDNPHGLIQIFGGSILIGDGSRASVWTPNGTLVSKLLGTISSASYLSQMSTGEIWYFGNGENRVVRVNSDGALIDTITDPALVCQDSGSIAQLAAGGYVVVCNNFGAGGRLIFLNSDRTVHKFAQAPAGMTLNADGSITHPDLAGPLEVIQLPNGDLLVAGCDVPKLIRLHSDGSYIDSTVLGSGCSNNGCPSSAFSVTLDHRGRILMGMGDNQVRVAQFQ